MGVLLLRIDFRKEIGVLGFTQPTGKLAA